MAQDIEVKIKVNTDQAVNDVNKLGNAFDSSAQDAKEAEKAFNKAGNGIEVEQSIAGLKQLKRELKNTAVGSEEFKKIYNQIDDLEDKLKSAKNVSSDWVDSLEQAGGPLGMLGAGINRAKVATQSFGGALKATGIGLIVSLLGGLVAAFSENEGAMKKLQPLLNGISKIFQGVFRAVEPLFNTFVDLAVSALPMVSKSFGVVYSSVTAVFQSLGMLGSAIKKLISGDFSGAWNDAKSSVNNFSKNYDASIKRFNDGTKEMTKSEKEEAEKREQNRKDALEKKAENERKAKEKAIQKEKEEAEAKQKIKDEADKEAIRQAESYRDKLEEVQKAEADAKKANEEALLTDQELAIKRENEAFETKKANAIKFGTDYQEIERQHLNTLNDINIKAQQKEYENAEKNKNDLIALQEAKKNAIIGMASSIANSLDIIDGNSNKKSKASIAIRKGLALADLAISTATSLGNAQKEATTEGAKMSALFPMIPGIGVAAKVVSYASTAAMVFGNIQKAKAILGGGGGDDSGSGGGISAGGAISAPASAAPQFNIVGQSGANQIASAIGGQEAQPIKAYVVSNDVTTGQALNRNIISNASLG